MTDISITSPVPSLGHTAYNIWLRWCNVGSTLVYQRGRCPRPSVLRLLSVPLDVRCSSDRQNVTRADSICRSRCSRVYERVKHGAWRRQQWWYASRQRRRPVIQPS